MARKLLRQVDAFTPVASQTMRRSMPLGTTVSRYVVRITGTLTVGVAVATILEDSPYGFVRSCEVVLNGSFPLRAGLHGRIYKFLNLMQYGTQPQFTAPAGAIGASAFVMEYTIDLGQPDLRPPLDSSFWLDTRLLNRLELVFGFGADADVATPGGGGTAVISALTCTIHAEEIADVGGPLSRMQQTRYQQQLTATGFNDLQIPALGPLYRAIAYHFTSANADPIRATSDDTILTDASLVADGLQRHVDAAPYRLIRSDNKVEFGVETLPAGWAVLNFAKSKNLRDVVQTRRAKQLISRLNIAAVPANTFVEWVPLNALLVVRGRNIGAAMTGAR